jgi:hypothetical protein
MSQQIPRKVFPQGRCFAILDTGCTNKKVRNTELPQALIPPFIYSPHHLISMYTSASHIPTHPLFSFLGVQILLQADTQFFPERLELFKVLIVLATVLNFRLDSCNDSKSADLSRTYPCARIDFRGDRRGGTYLRRSAQL